MDLATQGLIANSQKHLQDRTMSSSPEDDSIQQLKYAAVGSAAALAVDKSFDTLVISKQGHDKSLLGKAVAKIDNFVKNNAFMQSAEKKIESFANTVKTKNAELIAKSPAYKEVAELFNKGYKTKTMLTREPLLKTYEDISKNGRKKLIEARRNNGVIASAKRNLKNSKAIYSQKRLKIKSKY
ncbi:MAG: hypothetical protein MZV64_27175 [Ignavibacteriales bacterium]|nr:hypothetical protein [Ignavibacteriales bacterium]